MKEKLGKEESETINRNNLKTDNFEKGGILNKTNLKRHKPEEYSSGKNKCQEGKI